MALGESHQHRPAAGEPVRRRDQLLARAEALLAAGSRRILGITGPPGAGKSTLADWLQRTLRQRYGADPPLIAQAPMDGFHFPNAVLLERGIRDRKGAPDTFDVDAYLRLLREIRHHADQTLHAPGFDRTLEQPTPGTHPIPPSARLVVSDGNYLLLDRGRWREAAPCFDEIWYVTVDRRLAHRRLIRRQIHGGRSPEAAREWVDRSDMSNLELVEATAAGAHVRVDLPDLS